MYDNSQFGFTGGFGTRETFLVFRACDVDCDVRFCFIGFEKLFVKVYIT